MIKRMIRSFGYALCGLKTAIFEEKNLRFHLCTALLVLIFSCFYSFHKLEYIALFFAISSVIGAELFNSAIERAADKPDGKYNVYTKAAKDMAAGGVLVVCIGALCCGILLFWDVEAFRKMAVFFCANPWAAVLLILYLIGSVFFIFCFGKKESYETTQK